MPSADMTPLNAEQLDAYFAHLGIQAPPSPTLDALHAVIAAQLTRIPFENIDPLLRRPVRIDIDSVFDKLVSRGRGGYCFELNTLLAAALGALGYAVTPLAARVRWGVPETVQTMVSHMLLRVEVAHRSYIVDVGFGGPTPFRAMPLSGPADEKFPYRLAPAPVDASTGAFHCLDLEVAADADWRKVYRFDLTPQAWIDFIPRNWYTSTHPDSHFVHKLMAARTEGTTRLTLADGKFAEREADGRVRKQQLGTPAQFLDVLSDRFCIALDGELRGALGGLLPKLLAGTRAQ